MSRLTLLAVSIAVIGSTTLRAQQATVPIEEQTVANTVQDSNTVAANSTSAVLTPLDLNSANLTASVLMPVAPAGLHHLRAFDDRFAPQDTARRKAVTYSDWYARRLRVHRYGSYAMLPLFVTQYILGNKLLDQKNAQYAGTRVTPIDQNLRTTHKVVAGAVGALFVVNTTTGLWNLVASRNTVEGRKLRTIHALTMLTADAGFLYTGYLSSKAVDHGPADARKHRNVALGSFSIATVGASLMWFRRD